jgi:hypothetical protein
MFTVKDAVCSEICTKYINAIWALWRITECWTWWYVKLPLGFERLINSPHKISHKARRTATIFTTFIHNTSLDSVNKHMCCGLQSINRTHRTKKCGIPPAAATLPQLLHIFLFLIKMLETAKLLYIKRILSSNYFCYNVFTVSLMLREAKNVLLFFIPSAHICRDTFG